MVRELVKLEVVGGTFRPWRPLGGERLLRLGALRGNGGTCVRLRLLYATLLCLHICTPCGGEA